MGEVADWTERGGMQAVVVKRGADKATADSKKQQQMRGAPGESEVGSVAGALNSWGDGGSRVGLAGHSHSVYILYFIYVSGTPWCFRETGGVSIARPGCIVISISRASAGTEKQIIQKGSGT